MESMPNRGLPQAHAPEIVSTSQQQSLDIIKVLWRWKWLPILGALIGAGVGYMFYTKMPAQFQSMALVQVTSSVPASSSLELYDPEKVAQWANRNDESRVIKSQKVLGEAVRIGDLSQYFPGLPEAAIVFELMDPVKGVEVLPAERSEKVTTQQLYISYVSNNPDLSQAVVNAVIAGYQSFLSEEYRAVDEETLNYFRSAEQRLQASVDDLTDKYEGLVNQESNVLWNVDQPVDPYFNSYLKKKDMLEQIRIAQVKLKSTIQQVDEARKNGRPSEDILMWLNEGSDMVLGAFWKKIFEDPSLKGGWEHESDKMERTLLVQLQVREQELLRSLGANHPSVVSIRASIEAVNLQIEAARKNETAAMRELERNQAKSRLLEIAGQTEALSEKVANSIDETIREISEEKAKEGSQDRETAIDSVTMQHMSDHWLQMSVNAMIERFRSLGLEEKELEALAQDELKQSQELQQFLRQHNLLKEQIASMKELHSTFSEKVQAVNLVPSNANQKVLRELNPASEGFYYGPFPGRYVGGGAIVGILLMAGLALLMDMADRSYRSPDEIASDLGKPVLGHIPAMDLPNIKRVIDSVDESIITLHHSRGRIAESYRSVRTGLFFSSRGTDLKVVQVTSPVPGDGKSTLCANLAVTMAQSGRRVLLLDADFRRPRLHKIFGVDVEAGLAQCVSGEAELDEVTYSTCIANLSLMPGGKRPSNPAELLSSSRFSQLLEILKEKYDIIIIDTPPALAVSDPSVVASLVDGVVLAMRLRRNVKPLATRAFRVLESVDAQILGVVVNGVSTEAAYGGYGYNYSYNDYRYSYRSNYNYADGYRRYNSYAEYSAGYIEEKQSDSLESDVKNDAHS